MDEDQNASGIRRRHPRPAWRWLAFPLALLALLGALASGAWWALRTDRGTAWLLSVVPGVQTEGATGRLIGDFAVQRLRIVLPGGTTTITLTGAGWRGLRIERAASAAWLKLVIDALEIRRVDLVVTGSSTDKQPSAAPTDLHLPIELDLRALHIGELHTSASDAHPLRDLRAHLQLGAQDGTEHRIDALSFTRDTLQVSGDARIGSSAPMPLALALTLAQRADASLPALNATLSLSGPLAQPALQATLRSDGSTGKPAQSLDVQATLRPFASWPLGELQMSMQALDLSALASDAPSTSLSGSATASSTAADQPARVNVTLANANAGRWNEHRLPLRRATLTLVGRPDRPDVLTLQSLDAEIGNAQASAGRIEGQGHWSPDGWAIEATLAELQPALLDARAPAMHLEGSVAIDGGSTATPGRIDAKAKLGGRIVEAGAPRAVSLALDASLIDQRVEIRDLQASAGAARAALKGVVGWPGIEQQWLAKAQASLSDFEPALWWPALNDSIHRTAASRLNASADIDLRLPAAAMQGAPPALIAALRGQATLMLKPSLLAGVPLSGSASLHHNGGAAASADVALDADGNRLHASGRLAAGANGAADAWDLTLDAPALAQLAPVLRMLQPLSADATLAGSLQASAQLHGRWPAFTTDGQLDARALRIGTLSVASAQARWSLGSSADAPVEAEATLTNAGVTQSTTRGTTSGNTPSTTPGPSLESLHLQLNGTGRAHTLTLTAESKALPPAWADAVQPAVAPASAASIGAARTLATLQAHGGLIDAAGNALAGWRGTVSQLDLRSNAPGAAPLLHVQALAIDALWGDRPARITLEPGRAELLGAALRWSRIAWQAAGAAGGAAQIDADAELEPMRIAPILARLQPDFGWGGDLTIGGHLKLHSAPGFSADVVIERGTGDLTITEELGTRTLGLTDLRIGLVAADGAWSFTQAIAGKTLGVASGAVVVRTSADTLWPPADAPIQGVLELQVNDLGSWGPWVPPGWRLEGAVHSSASIGGRFGAPEYTGSVEGTRLAVRNFLLGVDVNGGDLAIRLAGPSAQIERFSAKAGDGTLNITGNASFGDAPQALLTIDADKFLLLGRVDRRIVTSGRGSLRIDSKTLALAGAFNVDEGLIDFSRSDAPTLSADVVVLRPQGVPSPAAAASAAATPAVPPINASASRAVALDLKVTLGEKLRLKGHGIDTGLRGELHLSSPGGKLAVNGSVRTADGTYAAYGQKLVIDRGEISFNGAVDNPRLDIEATRPNLDVRVGVAISGNASNPRVRLFSEPDLSDIDKLSWLVMGRASDAAGSSDTALLQSAALGLLAGEGSGPTDQITKALGLDDLSVHQSDGAVKETVVALGKQISRRWYVGYEHGLNATSGSFQLIYRIAQRITLRAQSGADNSLDLIWTWRWH